MSFRILIITMLFIALGIQPADGRPKDHDRPQPYDDPEAYEVYASILLTESMPEVQRANTLVIQIETKAYKMCLRPLVEFQDMMEPAIADYRRLNQRTWLLQRRFKLEKPVELIAYDEFRRLYRAGGWERFYELHPTSGGRIELSAVGFNADKTLAVVYAGRRCGGLCGGGRFYVLQKRSGKWERFDWKGSKCAWET